MLLTAAPPLPIETGKVGFVEAQHSAAVLSGIIKLLVIRDPPARLSGLATLGVGAPIAERLSETPCGYAHPCRGIPLNRPRALTADTDPS